MQTPLSMVKKTFFPLPICIHTGDLVILLVKMAASAFHAAYFLHYGDKAETFVCNPFPSCTILNKKLNSITHLLHTHQVV